MTKPSTPNLTLVVNPASGRGRAKRLLPGLVQRLQRELPGVDLDVWESSSYDHARELCVRAVATARPGVPGQRPDTLLVMGGDGIAHLGLNACGGTDVPLGVIPAGTGNDFCRGMGAATNAQGAVAAIIAGNTRRVDLAEVTGDLVGGRERELVGSIVSTGYDSRVNRRGNGMRWSLGSLAYTAAALRELRGFDPLPYRLLLDGELLETHAMFVTVGNAGVMGGGMQACPDADVTDGLLDLTIVHAVSRWVLIRMLPKMFDGSFRTHPAIEFRRATTVHIDGDGLFGMADGEELGPVPLTVTALPRALTLLVP